MGFADTRNVAAIDRPATRIENDIEHMKTMISHIERTTERIVQHARALGYEQPPSPATTTPMPVITTMADAISALAREIDRCAGSLNAFE